MLSDIVIPSQWVCPAAYPAARALSPGPEVKSSGGPQRPRDPDPGAPGAHDRLRARRPPGAADLCGAPARDRVRIVLPGPLGGDGPDDLWMHGVLLGLGPYWPQLRPRLARSLIGPQRKFLIAEANRMCLGFHCRQVRPS